MKPIVRAATAVAAIGVGGWLWNEFHRDIAFFLIIFVGRFVGPFLHVVIWLVIDVVPLALALAVAVWAVNGFADQAEE